MAPRLLNIRLKALADGRLKAHTRARVSDYSRVPFAITEAPPTSTGIGYPALANSPLLLPLQLGAIGPRHQRTAPSLLPS